MVFGSAVLDVVFGFVAVFADGFFAVVLVVLAVVFVDSFSCVLALRVVVVGFFVVLTFSVGFCVAGLVGVAVGFFAVVLVVLAVVFVDSFSCVLALRVVVVGFFVAGLSCLLSFLILIMSPLSEFPIGFVLVDIVWQNFCNQQFFVFAQKAFHCPTWRDKQRITIKFPMGRFAMICPDSIGA